MEMRELLQLLAAQSGPRGATFMGRHIPYGQQPSIGQVMAQFPLDIPEESYGSMSLYNQPLLKRLGMGKETSPDDLLRRYANSATSAVRDYEQRRKNQE